MSHLLNAYIDIYAAILILILFTIIVTRKDIYSFHERLLLTLITSSFVVLLLEAISFFIDGQLEYYGLHIVINTFLFLISSILGTVWALYADYKIYHSKKRLARHHYYVYPMIITTILLIINFFEPVLFYYDSQGFYHRGSLMIIVVVVLFALCFYLVINTFKNRKDFISRKFYGLLALLLFPAIGGAIQMMYYGFSALYSMFALGLMTGYIALENVGTNTDPLTDLFKRDKVMSYINSLRDKQTCFSLILFDMDNLKKLNDEQGHHIGDLAIIKLSTLLKKYFNKNGMVARVGGDEFLAVTQNIDDVWVAETLQKIKEELSKDKKIVVKYSLGQACYTNQKNSSVEDLLRMVDKLMYEDKALHKKTNYR